MQALPAVRAAGQQLAAAALAALAAALAALAALAAAAAAGWAELPQGQRDDDAVWRYEVHALLAER